MLKSVLDEVISEIKSDTKKSDKFLSTQNDVASNIQGITKRLYDFLKDQSVDKNDALPELVIQDFDEEQIWQQLEIQNEGEFTNFLTRVSQLLSGNNDKITLPINLTKVEAGEEAEGGDEPQDEGSHQSADESTNIDIPDDEMSGSDDDMDLDIDVDGNFRKKKVRARKPFIKPSVVDDKFFKLNQLEHFLMTEDKKELKDHQTDSDESDDEGGLDLFEDHSDNENDNHDDTKDSKLIYYQEFFDSPESADDENGSNGAMEPESKGNSEAEEDSVDNNPKKRKLKDSKPKDKRVKFNLTNDSDDTDSIEDNRIEEKQSNELKSTLEKRQERLQMRVEELENQAISEKPWQLKGEVTASNRPQNSLLEEYVEFDITSRPAPVITEETTLKLEDIIKQRIKDKAWDDVEKKFKPVETPLEYKKKLVMDQEKSQKSLAQIYEEAYMKQKGALNPNDQEREEEDPKEHKEVRELMHALFKKLDALSNFHYTPKPAQPDIKIVSNVPAISMEEVAPVATTDATLLAPEEVQAKRRGDLVGKSERTQTDMKRARRKKKVYQREKQIASEKKEKSLAENLKTNNKKHNKNAQSAMIKKLTKDRNITKIDETTQRAPKSSTAFFTQLQDDVTSLIKSKANRSTKKKEKNVHSAVKLKL